MATCSDTSDDKFGNNATTGFTWNDMDNTSDGDKNISDKICTQIYCDLFFVVVLSGALSKSRSPLSHKNANREHNLWDVLWALNKWFDLLILNSN